MNFEQYAKKHNYDHTFNNANNRMYHDLMTHKENWSNLTKRDVEKIDKEAKKEDKYADEHPSPFHIIL